MGGAYDQQEKGRHIRYIAAGLHFSSSCVLNKTGSHMLDDPHKALSCYRGFQHEK